MFEAPLDGLSWPIAAGSRTALGPLPGSAPAWVLGELARRQGLQLVITPDSHSANMLPRLRVAVSFRIRR